MDFKGAITPYAEVPLSRQILMHILKDYERPYDKINQLVKEGQLSPVKKGLYIPGLNLRTFKPESFLIANHLWGPSHVSLESALSFWGLIPERVYETTSITIKAAKKYNTAVGRFSYTHVPLPYYAFGLKSVTLTEKQVALIATPEKALCDKIITTTGIYLRSVKQTKEFLIDDLRMEEEMLGKLNLKEINSWVEHAPKKSSLEMMIKTLWSY